MNFDLSIMQNFIKEYYGDYIYLVFSVFAAVYLLVVDRKKYKIVLIPCALLYIIILNPIVYNLLNSRIIYWRLLWTIPGSFIITLAIGELLKRIDLISHKILLIISIMIIVSVLGTNVFKNARRGSVNNIYRLSPETVDVGKALLDNDKTPKCIVPSGLLSSIRLYSGDIEPMYGRNAEGYINRASDEVKNMYSVIESDNPDYEYVLIRAKHWGYNFVLNTENKPIDNDLLNEYGYFLLKNTDGYNIYYNPNMNDNMVEGYFWRYNDTGWWLENSDGDFITDDVEVYGIGYKFDKNGYAIEK